MCFHAGSAESTQFMYAKRVHNLPEGWTSETLQAPLRAYAQQLSSYPTCFSLLAVAALIAACV